MDPDFVGNRALLVKFCVLLCILNIVLVAALAGLGVLKTAQTGDIEYTTSHRATDFFEETLGRDRYELPADSPDRFAVESPTDADTYYDTVIRVRNGGVLYDFGYKYAPPIYFLFVPFAQFGYVPFKVLWLLASIVATVVGTYLLVRAEERHRDLGVSKAQAGLLSVAAIGFTPMLSNLKVGQITPIIYLFVGVGWWYARKRRDFAAGSAFALAALVKPYFGAPLVLFFGRDRASGVLAAALVAVLATLLSVTVFGVEALVDYARILLAHIEGAEPASVRTIADKSVELFDPLFPFGSAQSVVGFLFAVPLLYAAYAADERADDAGLFALALVSIPLIVSDTSTIDVAAVLAAIVVLGYRFHDERRAFGALVLGFLLLMVHPYAMELLIGRGHANVAAVVASAGLPLYPLYFLQPGIYGLAILFVLSMYACGFTMPSGVWRRTANE